MDRHDGTRGITMSVAELDGLTDGLPSSAHRAQWWYGCWNPERAQLPAEWVAVEEPLWIQLLNKRPQSRAWMAAGFRASPSVRKGTGLESVTFVPVTGREYWWSSREQLRRGVYVDRVELPSRVP